ncbi:hypothetical protein FHR24_001071 [Wenyingzhuangia heitensis]|uniref:PKD domain-containing protein n=1 Tax=Wenyingzhuangia heitensis TaxID=1487859 RepID=A0ABX0U6Z4_9FLAO|nr:hypothetical protein [Wenyingzhuangia heitensis]NIJ44632.1 hypothetical protein [Wenyingzhuangia heitensis]
MNLFKKGISALLCAGLIVSCSTNDEDSIASGSAIANLDFTITSSGLGNIVSVTPSATGAASYSVDFGTDATDDVLATVGPKVSYTYPSVATSYDITVTASATGVESVSKTTSYTVVLEQSDIVGRWVLLHEAGALAVGPNLEGVGTWWANDLATVKTRSCLFDDIYEFKADNSFNNIIGDATWLEGSWESVETESCGTAISPFDGSITTATWSHDPTAETVTISGLGAFLGVSKVHNSGELTDPAGAKESITYSGVTFSEDKNTMTLHIQYDGAGNTWQFKFAKEGTAGAVLPEIDSDNDGVNDADDACPNIAGTNNGCPDVTDVTTVAATPTASNVASIYSDAYTSVANVNVNPGWGQATKFAEIEPETGNSVLQYSFLDYQGTTFDAINISSYTHIHLDVHSSEIDKLNITLINTADASGTTFEVGVDNVLTSGEWTSIDIPLADFVGLTASGAIDQLKYGVSEDGTATGASSFHVDNIYLY